MKLGELKIIQQSRAREVLQRAIRHQRLAHAFLLFGPEGSGKEALALAFAQTLLCSKRTQASSSPAVDLFGAPAAEPQRDWACNTCSACKRVAEVAHPDLHVILPRPASASEQDRLEVLQSLAAQPFNRLRQWENPFILIEDIRELKKNFSVSSYEGRGAVALILEAERLKMESANALLKILEEPPADKYFILTATSLESVLPTIVSRCQPIAQSPLSRAEIAGFLQQQHNLPAERADAVALMANGNLRQAFALLAEEIEAKRKLAVEYLRMAFKFNKPVEQVEFLNRLTHEYDRRELQQILQFCLLWIRDAYVLKASNAASEQNIINVDFRTALLELVKNLPQFEFDGVLEEIEYAMHCLERYVQPWLVLMVLLQRIQHLAKPSRSKS
ncbi:MAG: ATP-binding protein [bacterium]